MSVQTAQFKHVSYLWDEAKAASMAGDEVALLIYRSNLLGADLRLTNYGGPTWESNDGSKVTGKQLALSPSNNAASIPLQLVQANPATGNGAMTGVTYIQRLNTKGGIAPMDACTADNVGAKKTVKYEADYVFFKAM